jgi:hypothetical protein
MFGGTGGGTVDDTAALVAASDQAITAKMPLRLLPGKTYKFSSWAIPAGCIVEGAGATLRSDGAATGLSSDVPGSSSNLVKLKLLSGCRFDSLTISTPGTESAHPDIMEIGAGVTGDSLTVLSDVQRGDPSVGGMGGIMCPDPNNIRIGTVRTVNIDRPLHLYNTSTTTMATGSVIGFLDVTNYIRGFRADFCSFVLGGARMVGRSPHATPLMQNGHNGVLLQGCSFFQIGDLWIDDAAEHAFRIGGSPATPISAYSGDFQVGDIHIRNCAGCALKINPSRETSPGVSERCLRGSFGYISAYDVGGVDTGGNRELLRLTHFYQGYIAGAYAQTGPDHISAQYLLQLNDCDDILIGDLGGDGVEEAFIIIEGSSDANVLVDGVPAAFGGPVGNIKINRLWGRCNGAEAIRVHAVSAAAYPTTTIFEVGEFTISECQITGFTTNLLNWVAGTSTGVFDISGSVYGLVAPTVSGAPANTVRANIKWGRGWAPLTAFSETLTGTGLHVINNAGLPAASGNYGGGIVMSRLNSARRGAAIVGRQFNVAEEAFGLEFLVSSSTTSSDTLLEALRITHQGALQIRDSAITVPATSTGWASLYVESNALKVKFSNGTIKTIATNP